MTSFLIPCDDIVSDIETKHESLSLNLSLIVIGYQQNGWSHSAAINQCSFTAFQSLSSESITVHNIVYIKYVDIYLWHKYDKIDRMFGSGNKSNYDKTWDQIKSHYLHLMRDGDDEKKEQFKVILNESPKALPSQKNKPSYFYGDGGAQQIAQNGYYSVWSDEDGKTVKVKIEKYLKKSIKKTKVYDQSINFKYLTPNQLDAVYRIYEDMEVNIVNCTSLNALYRIQREKGKQFKKVCVLNVNGVNNLFHRNSTINHSLDQQVVDATPDQSDEAAPFLYTNSMIYSPNCVVFRDWNGEFMRNHFKVSFLTVYPIDSEQYFEAQRRRLFLPMIENKLKKLDEKLNQSKLQKKQHQKKKKKDKVSPKQSNEELAAKLDAMNDVINEMIKDRIRRMIEVAIYNGCDAIIFDAFCCQKQFGNDVRQIANIFSDFMKNIYRNCFKAVFFAMTDRPHRYYCRCCSCSRSTNKANHTLSTFTIFKDAFQAN